MLKMSPFWWHLRIDVGSNLPEQLHEFNLGFSGVRVTWALFLSVMFCRSFFVLLFFFLLAIVLFVLDLRILITSLVSSNYSSILLNPGYFTTSTLFTSRSIFYVTPVYLPIHVHWKTLHLKYTSINSLCQCNTRFGNFSNICNNFKVNTN